MNNEKIEQLITKMIAEQEKIQFVNRSNDDSDSGEEYYFNFPSEKYLWSIMQFNNGEIYLFYYPDKDNKNQFLRIGQDELKGVKQDQIKEVFQIVRAKIFGFDKVLKDILGD